MESRLIALLSPLRDPASLALDSAPNAPPVKKLAKDVVLLEHVAEEKVKMLEPACTNCGAAAKMKCTQCGAAICSTACANERWPEHKPVCRGRQASEFGRVFWGGWSYNGYFLIALMTAQSPCGVFEPDARG